MDTPHSFAVVELIEADDDRSLFDRGLAYDLATLVDRRQMLKIIGFTGLSAGIAACAPGATPGTSAAASSGASAAASSAADCAVIPEETAGPYPGDGSNGPDVLSQSGVVRGDIRSSFGASSGTAEGIPLTVRVAVQDATGGCAPLAGAAVYLWHCDREGRYSLYSQGVEDQNYLRGVQAAGDDGIVTFQSIFPACYTGRWPHIHFEVYPSLELATDEANKVATSQFALPEEVCDLVYATSGYEQSVSNLSQLSIDTDNVFGEDGGARQLGTVTGSVDAGYSVELAVPVGA